MYGLNKIAQLAYNKLCPHLKHYGYSSDNVCPDILCIHEIDKTKFCPCVDDFGVHYLNTVDKKHLTNTLQNKYKITIKKTVKSTSVDRNFANGWIDVSIPKFVQNILQTFNFKPTRKTKKFLQTWSIPTYIYVYIHEIK